MKIKKFILGLALMSLCASMAFVANAATDQGYNVHLPSWGGDVNCVTQAKTSNDLYSKVKPADGTDNANYWAVKHSDNTRLSATQYVPKSQVGEWFTLTYKAGKTAYSGDNIILRADGASPASGTAKGFFNAQ